MPFLNKHAKDVLTDTRAGRGMGVESAAHWARDEYVPGSAYRDAGRSAPPAGMMHQPGRQLCANAECTGGWKMPWRNRRRPIFEDRWGCSTRCLEALIRKATRRERGDLHPPLEDGTPHRHRVPLGLVMLSHGWITQAQLRKALEAQRSAGQGRIGDWLIEECGLSPAQITRGLAAQWSCPVLPMDGFAPAAMALTVPRLLVEEFGLLPLRVAGSRILYLAFNDRLDASAAFAVERISGLKVESGLLDDSQFQAARSRVLESTFVTAKQESFIDTDTLAAKIAAVLDQVQPIGSRLVRVHQHYWLRTWLETGAYSGVGSFPATGEDVTDTIFTLGSSA